MEVSSKKKKHINMIMEGIKVRIIKQIVVMK